MDLTKKQLHIGKLRLSGADIAAIVVFAAFAVCLFVSAPYGLTEADEPLYQVYEYRLMKGDRLFYDDWTLTPFSTLFNYLPFALFYSAAGGAQGALLALRYFFVVCKLAAFAAVYCGLRSRGYWAVAAASVFCGAFAFGIKTLNYYFICGCALLFTGWVLFLRKESRPWLYGLAGFVFSCAVLSEPSMAAIWFVYSALVLCRYICRKKNARFLENYGFALAPAVWRALFFGILAAAALLLILCAAFFMRVSPAGLAEGFRNALNDPERSGGVAALLSGRLSILGIYAEIYHPAFLGAYGISLLACVLLRRFHRQASRVCFAVCIVLYAALTVRALTYPMERIGYAVGETVSHPLPLCLLGLTAYFCTARKDRRLLAFLMLGFAAMLCGDMISMTAFGAFSEVIAVPALFALRDLAAEVFAKKNVAAAPKGKAKAKAEKDLPRRVFAALFAAGMAFMPAAEAAHGVYLMGLHETERLFAGSDAPLDTVIGVGSLKGLRTTAEIAANYEKSVKDAETIRALCENRLYVADLAPAVYLDADRLIAAHSPYYYYQEGWERVSLWWQMHPEKRPDAVYIPHIRFSYMEYPDASPEEKLAWLRSHAEIEVTEGEIGSIVKILRWHTA